MPRLIIFADGSHLYRESDRLSKGLRTNFGKFRADISEGFDLIRTFYCASSAANPTTGQSAFFKRLEYLGFRARIRPLRETILPGGHSESREKGVDVALATDSEPLTR